MSTGEEPVEIYVRHQGGHEDGVNGAMMVFHLSQEQRMQLIAALAGGHEVDLAGNLELNVLTHWVADWNSDSPHVCIPLEKIAFTSTD